MNKEINAKDLEPNKFELEVGEQVYILELDNEAVKKADDMNLASKLVSKELGLRESLSSLIYVFLMKNAPSVTLNLSKKIAESIVDGKNYDVNELLSILIEEFALRYSQVFTSRGAKKSLKKI